MSTASFLCVQMGGWLQSPRSTQIRRLFGFLDKAGQFLSVSRRVGCRGYLAGLGGSPSPRGPRALTYVAVVHPDAVAIVAGPALHDVVAVVRLRDLVVGVNDDLGARQIGVGC